MRCDVWCVVYNTSCIDGCDVSDVHVVCCVMLHALLLYAMLCVMCVVVYVLCVVWCVLWIMCRVSYVV